MKLMNILVYRVSWLRSKARHDRWVEQEGTLRSEMGWTISFFNNQENAWNKRAALRRGNGHEAYALRQAAMWGKFSKEGTRILRNYMNGSHSRI
jgi:hypothetical protein